MLMKKERASWTEELVEERLIEAVELWGRSAAFGYSLGSGPFATDAPWHLLTRAVRAGSTMDAWRVEQDEQLARDPRPAPARGLSAAEVTRRDQAGEWLRFVPERDRKLLVEAVSEQARTGRRVDWMGMRAKVGVRLGADGLRKRYWRALGSIVRELGRGRVPMAA